MVIICLFPHYRPPYTHHHSCHLVFVVWVWCGVVDVVKSVNTHVEAMEVDEVAASLVTGHIK